jgi:hypothetical protein
LTTIVRPVEELERVSDRPSPSTDSAAELAASICCCGFSMPASS